MRCRRKLRSPCGEDRPPRSSHPALRLATVSPSMLPALTVQTPAIARKHSHKSGTANLAESDVGSRWLEAVGASYSGHDGKRLLCSARAVLRMSFTCLQTRQTLAFAGKALSSLSSLSERCLTLDCQLCRVGVGSLSRPGAASMIVALDKALVRDRSATITSSCLSL